MDLKKKLLKEIDSVSDNFLKEIIDFVDFLKKREHLKTISIAEIKEKKAARDCLITDEDDVW